MSMSAVLSPENVERIRAALVDLKPVHRQTHRRLSFLEHPAAGQAVQNLYLETDHGIIDILSNVLGVGDFYRLREHAETVTLFGRKVAVISIDDLIAAKEAVGRDKDKLTAKELRCLVAMRSKPDPS